MALLVLVTTLIVADIVQSPLDAARTTKDALASALYVANYRFALQQTNYLAAGLSPSPFQHYWSLGVEEQMYLVWPLILVATGVWRRRWLAHRAALTLFIGSLASFAYCVRLTASNEPWAFFSFPTRAWELGIGGLVAFAAPRLRKVPGGAASLLGLAGLAAVLWSAVAFTGSTPWPGDRAAFPVLGAAAIVAAGCAGGRRLAARVLRVGPLQFAGRISYPWYLWHWPVLVLAPLVLHHPLDRWQAVELAAATGALATVSHYLIERPIHLSQWLAQRSRRGLGLGLGLTAVAVTTCALSSAALALPTVRVAQPVLVPQTVPKLAHVNPNVQLLATSTAALQTDLSSSAAATSVPDDLTPSLAGAYGDVPVLYGDGCVDSYTSTVLGACTYGDSSSSTKVVLFGDSHAAMWFPAVDQAAQRYSWKLYAWTKDTCPPLQLNLISPVLDREYTECGRWRDEVLEQIARLHPALVILGVARHYSPIYGFTTYGAGWMDGLTGMITAIRQLGSKVIVLGPIPKPSFSVPSCLSENLTTATSCETLRGAGVNLPGMRAEEATVRAAGGSYVNTLFWFCTTKAVCPPIVDGVLVYRDDNHITASYAALLAPPLEAALELAAQGVPSLRSAIFLPAPAQSSP
jgi:peptidoglycan/LPS O-acetylase OafA/YrhL